MTGFKSKRDMAEDKLLPQKDFGDALTIAYQSGYYDGKKAAQRPWVGLTEEEAAECWTTTATQTWKNIENALRSKNT